MLKSILAIIVGFAAAAVVVVAATFGAATLLQVEWGQPTAPYLALNLIGSAGGAGLGGYLAARLAPKAPRVHALVLAGVMLALSLPAVFSPSNVGQPEWYSRAIAVIGPLCVVLGSLLAPARVSPATEEDA